MLHLEVPGGCSEVLLHSCCAPCSGAVLECLLASGIKTTVFFSNSNIVPREEYDLRLSELRRYCSSLGIELVEDEYDHEAWRTFVLETAGDSSNRGRTPSDIETAGPDCIKSELSSRAAALASSPERGPRCLNCFKFRLKRAADYASAHNIPVLTTTLASSRWKSLEQVAAAGAWACGCASSVTPHVTTWMSTADPIGVQGDSIKRPEKSQVLFWNQNWRKGGLQERRSQIICEQNFYNQNWCGCEFSHRTI